MVLRDEPSDQALRVSETGESKDAFWLPRSQILDRQATGKFHQAGVGAPKFAVEQFDVPEWLALKEGLV